MIRKWIVYTLLILSAGVLFFPLLFAVIASFLTSQELHSGQYIPTSFNLENYILAFQSVPLVKFLMNSLIVSGLVMIGQLLLCSLAAYAIVFVPFRGRTFVFYLIVATLLIPWEATMIPNYLTMFQLELLSTYRALTLPFLTSAFGIFLLRQHFLTLPRELYESAQIDGCSRFRYFWAFALPLSRPVLIALGIYAFLTTWNMYLWPMLVSNDESVRTVQIGIKMMITQEASTAWNMVMAGVVIILLPTLLLLFFGLKYIRRGLMSGALKG